MNTTMTNSVNLKSVSHKGVTVTMVKLSSGEYQTFIKEIGKTARMIGWHYQAYELANTVFEYALSLGRNHGI